MVIVTGSVKVLADKLDDAIALSLEHVLRSRAEPGCLSHAVHQNVEDRCHLFFFEQWADRAALAAHFAVPESAAFIQALAGLTASPPEMLLYEAEAL